jgi:hypothetical protein
MLLFLNIKMSFRSQNKSHKRQKISLTSGVGKTGHISAVCSHCYLMVPDHVIHMFVDVELWTKF